LEAELLVEVWHVNDGNPSHYKVVIPWNHKYFVSTLAFITNASIKIYYSPTHAQVIVLIPS
jgi:hypothetical protein